MGGVAHPVKGGLGLLESVYLVDDRLQPVLGHGSRHALELNP